TQLQILILPPMAFSVGTMHETPIDATPDPNTASNGLLSGHYA
ncbi:hypothetical protein AVEN_43060-1, partial [Araneus ventricosus]